MQSLLSAVLVGMFVFACAPIRASAKDPRRLPPTEEPHAGTISENDVGRLPPTDGPVLAGNSSREAERELPDFGKLQKQVDLQQRQIQTLEKITQLLADQHERQGEEALPDGGSQQQTAIFEHGAAEAAQRDRQLADAIDDLNEQLNARDRAGADLPATLRELYLPTRTNESPLSIFGTLSTGYQDYEDAHSSFTSPVFSPHFYLLLNQQFLLEGNPEIQGDGIDLESAQLDWFATDHLTLVVGRFYSPLGFYNERIHTSWISKLPDRPLMFAQVFPSPLSDVGVMARGASYLGDSPLKLEYASFVANGLAMEEEVPDAHDFADIYSMAESLNDVNDSKAVGGRVGLSFPEVGVIVGCSGMANGDYDVAGQNSFAVLDVDANWHRDNWDFRFEAAHTDQHTPMGPIDRKGFYTQIAYRPYDSDHPCIQKLEGVFRFDCVRFDGIDLVETGTNFGNRARIPIDRNRYTIGLNYYPYPSLILKLAYQISDEINAQEIDDDGVLARVDWGW